MSKHGWTYKKVSDICTKGGSNIVLNKIEDNFGDFPLYGATGFIKNIDFFHNDVAYIGVVKDGSGAGKVDIYPAKSSLVSTMQYIFPKDNCNIRYLMYVLRGLSLEKFKNGAAIPHIYFRDYGKCLVPVPGMAEQEAIVAELDEINEAITALQQQVADLDTLAQATFYDMFGDPVTNPKAWEVELLENVVSKDCKISYGIVQPGDDHVNGVPVVRPIDLANHIVTVKGLKRVEPSISNSYKRTILQGNEILFCVRGTTGVMSFASHELKGCNVTRGITPLSFDSNATKFFVYFLLKSKHLQDLIAEKTRGIALKQINMNDVRELPVFLPPLALQQEFAAQVEAIEAAKAELNAQIAEMQTLLASRMDYYFE